jgi:serine/threonine protein kinase
VLKNIHSIPGAQQSHIVKYYGAFHLKVDTPWVVIPMELCDGSLEEYIACQEYSRMQSSERRATGWEIVRQIADGLRVCHSMNPVVMHRDIKPANSEIPFPRHSDF